MLLGTQKISRHGHLEIGGCDTVELAKEFGTPLYVMDEAAIRDNCRRYRAAFDARYPHNVFCYAGKAFLTLAMCRLIEEEGFHLDVAALGELHLALKAGFPARRINLHGNNKTPEELELAVARRVGHVVVDNVREIELLAEVLARHGRTMRVLVRCAPGVDPDTHKFIRTGQADTKFGLNIADGSALEAVSMVIACPHLRFDGIHFHVGSQLLDAEAHEGALDAAVGLMEDIRRETGAHCSILNIGGGLGVRYREHHRPPSFEEFAEAITRRLRSALDARRLPYPVLQQEPGRAIVAEAGTTLYTVGVCKSVPIREKPGTRTYVCIDGGLSDNPRPQLYHAEYEMIVANKAKQPHDQVITLAGRHCETDVLIWNARSAQVEPGDLVAVQTTGAYNHSMASNYNRFQRPAVVFVREGRADLVVRRESLADLVRNEVLPERLRRRPRRGSE